MVPLSNVIHIFSPSFPHVILFPSCPHIVLHFPSGVLFIGADGRFGLFGLSEYLKLNCLCVENIVCKQCGLVKR